MKRIFLLFGMVLVVMSTSSQTTAPQKRFIYSWHIDEQFATPDSVPMDTIRLNYQDGNIIDRFSVANSYNGNYGSPIQSKIYMNRPQGTDFVFEDSYKPYLMDVPAALYYDASFPYTNLTYLTGGPVSNREEQVKFIFTASPSKKANFGTNLDYLYSKGRYSNTAAQRFSGDLFGRYTGKHYSAYAFAATNTHQNHENGGLSNLDLLTNPDVDVEHKDMPVFIHGYSVFKKNTLFYNHNYSIGINREVKVNEDSTAYEYVPVTRFGHMIKFEEMKKRYHEPSSTERSFYTNTYDSINLTNDTVAVRTLTNLLSVNIAEEFNRWMRFGVTGYAENEVQQFTYFKDSTLQRETLSNTRVGGMLSKTQGSHFRYNFLGDIYLIGYKLGEFRLQGKVEGDFKLWNEEVKLAANAFVRNEQPSFFLQKYYSNHFRWENNFSKMYKTHLGGIFELPKRKTKLNVSVENISNYIYLNEQALPVQHSGNLQVFSVDLKQDVSFGAFTLENNVVYQASSDQAVLPLPDLVLYHNFYYHGKWFVDLYPQFGVSVRYHTKYFAPSYMPATGQFFNQQTIEIGNYPVINVYANFHLKKARFFFDYTNLGGWFLDGWGYHMPNYPINPPMLKMGVSWNFYD
ncbi:MAG: putative porin [Paludibacteraceae bacterium]